MDNLISETNARLQELIDNLTTIKNEYESKLEKNAQEIEVELTKVKDYKEEFFTSKEKIDKMNSDIEGFEQDYQNLVDRFKDDELANILIAANKEISLKIDERKRKIMSDKQAMNGLVEKAEKVKKKLVKLTAEKKALELCLEKILDSYEYYSKELGSIIEYSNNNKGHLTSKVNVQSEDIKLDDEEFNIESMKENKYDEDTVEDTTVNEEPSEDSSIVIDNPEYDGIPSNIINDDEITDEEDITPIDNIPDITPIEEVNEESEESEDENNEQDSTNDDDMSMEKFMENNIEENPSDEIKLVSDDDNKVSDENVEEVPEIPSSLFNFDDDIYVADDEIEDE